MSAAITSAPESESMFSLAEQLFRSLYKNQNFGCQQNWSSAKKQPTNFAFSNCDTLIFWLSLSIQFSKRDDKTQPCRRSSSRNAKLLRHFLELILTNPVICLLLINTACKNIIYIPPGFFKNFPQSENLIHHDLNVMLDANSFFTFVSATAFCMILQATLDLRDFLFRNVLNFPEGKEQGGKQ